jgi:hypothetical protein
MERETTHKQKQEKYSANAGHLKTFDDVALEG